MGAVYKKELKSFFTTMTGYVFIAVILVAVGVPMALNNFLSLSNDFESNFSSILFIILFLFSIP